jgi:acyl transferase domain-containing protein/3-hydroxymyristoyl/3-hydroxydecanoyl-(acyl carrier protein) dehydratase
MLPGALSPEALWEAVAAGTDLITQVPADRWGLSPADALCGPGESDSTDRTWSDRGGYVRGFDSVFDPTGFGVAADELAGLDPVFHWTLHTARAALRDAGYAETNAARFGAIFGNLSFPSAGMAAFAQAVSLSDADKAGARNRFMSGLPALLLERALGLGGGAFAIDAACASSLYAIKLACDRLHDGTADLMLAGAVNCADDLFIHMGFTALQALSRSGRSRPFHPHADGLVPAEGCAFVALRRLDDAVRDGDTIHGIIRGVGLSNDGRGRGMLVPSERGQAIAIAEALDLAGLQPTDISLLECHATGTQVGDATEVRSTASVYADCVDLPIGSLKSNTGHLITAAGVAGLIKVIEAMRHETRPPSLHAETTLDALVGSPFRVLQTAEAWDRATTSDGVLRAGVSAFGFGGNNAHLIIEEPSLAASLVEQARSTVPPPVPIAIVGIGVTAASAVGRRAFTDAIIGNTSCLNEFGDGPMPDIALRLAEQRFPPKDLNAALRQQLAILQVADEALEVVGPLPGATTGVYVGMGTDPQAARFGVRWRLATVASQLGASAEWTAAARDAIGAPLDAAGVLGTMPNLVANRLNSQYDISGPSFTVSSEEHSGLDALAIAVRALRAGNIDAALVGAVDMSCDPVHRAACNALGDNRRPGDAAVVLVLKRLDDAERDGNTVYAVVTGDRVDGRADLHFGVGNGATGVGHLFGHAHAASGLVHVAAAVLALHHRVTLGDVPIVASNPEAGTGLADGVGPRTIRVATHGMDGVTPRSVLLAEATGHPAPSRCVAPQLHIFSAATTSELSADVAAGRETRDCGPVRLVIVASHARQLAERRAKALRHIEFGHPAGRGVHYREAPLAGEMAFVFTGGGAAYRGMGAQLLRAMPETIDALSTNFGLGEVAAWIFDEGHQPNASDYLWGTSLLSQAHARLTLDVLKLQPQAAIGYSSGETNSLFAFGVWRDMEAMRHEITESNMMDRELGVSFTAIARAWEVERAEWAVWNVLAPVDEVRAAIVDEDRVHLMLVNTSRDVVISGDASACERVVDALGRQRCRAVGYNLACHVPEVGTAFHEQWLSVHTRHVTPVDGVRFYSNGTNGAYEVSTAACAAAITAQAESTVNFPATIEAAYADGVRIFVEHGPAGACTNFVREILADRDVLAVQLDRRGDDIDQVFEAVAALIAAGVSVDHAALTERVNRHEPVASAPEGPILSFAVHPAAPVLPPLPMRTSHSFQMMEPAPPLPSVFDRRPAHVAPVTTRPVTESFSVVDVLRQEVAAMAAMHERFVAQQAAMHERFLATRHVMNDLGHLSLTEHTEVSECQPDPPTRPRWEKAQLEIHSSGRISDLFGSAFAEQDHYTLQCRMPEPPLLLADRVTDLQAEPGVLGTGTIWTETDVATDSWYLNDGYMPTGFMIESGQADLMLISYMGIDLLNKGERVYRLLGCTLTYHGNLPSAGETLRYEIRITGHAKHGDVRLFFFEYDCTINGVPRLTVRDAQAGFFSRQELDDALGILWTPEIGRSALDSGARVDPPLVACTKATFDNSDVVAFSEGRVLDCFGPGFEWTETHTRTPKIQSGAQLFIDEVTAFDPSGGPWGRGFLRAEWAVADDAWFFKGHFKNDPCMPGNFMVEACIEALSFYLAALGHTTRRDGWRFQPLPELPIELKCRGEINPRTTRVAYEVHVEEVWDGPHPTVIADVVGFVDGHAAFHAHRIGVELVPDWPLTSMPALVQRTSNETVAVATDGHGFAFDWKAMISTAWGRPSDAFGSMYEMFDGTRRSPRLPGEPYHFISRVTHIDGDLNDCKAGMEMTCEYDIPDDAWYFDANGTETMPFAVLLEAALQPCGWVASAVGSATQFDRDVLFRNLDGTGTLTSELTRTSGTLRTRVKLTSVSRAGGMIIERFDVVCSLGDRDVFTMTTVFGFFPPEAFVNQVGLAVTDDQRATLTRLGSPPVDLTKRPERFCAGSPRLAQPMLLMLDRVTHLVGEGAAGLGIVRGQKHVYVSEWFFKAHFFQDPVQPGSLGVEALLQLLQFYLLDTDLGCGVSGGHFEPIMLGAPLTWTYRGQVTPANKTITSVMEITDAGVDERGPYAVGTGSLWCDGLRIYEVVNMGMRIVPDTPELAAPGSSQMAFRVDKSTHPHLVDHAVGGVPVVPVAYAMEWFARAAAKHRPDLHIVELSDLRVLKGLAIDGFAEGAGLDVVVTVTDLGTVSDATEVGLELADAATGMLRYRARGRLIADLPIPGSHLAETARPGPSVASDVYGGVLFHGPAFQVIDAVESVSSAGLTASATGVLRHDWPSEPWVTDPALLDGALQAALLWTEHLLDAPSLPTAIAHVRWCGPPTGEMHTIRVSGVRATTYTIVCDIELTSPDGRVTATLSGVETTRIPARTSGST